MSDGTQGPTRPNTDSEGSSVLQNLPRTRPQRASPRRAAARRSAARKTGAGALPNQPAEANGSAPRAAARAEAGGATAGTKSTRAARETTRRAPGGRAGKRGTGAARGAKRSVPKLDEVPPQGYESEDDAATGAVRPPGGAELVLSAAEIVGELAKAGLSRSERLMKDVLARLPLS
ncbi:MAG TPA: hypothetical protein VGO14_08965 [Solirubrobacteraceae bacterium]|nr:hypothetical protein [Solirubrobacteraceae bacterium]